MTEVYLFDSQIKFTNDDGRLTDLAFIFLNQLWERTGGPTDAITSDTEESIATYSWGTPFFDSDTQFISTGTDFTTYGNSIIVATSNITITLNPNPINEEKVTVKRATGLGTVTISASAIDGTTNYKLITNYEAAQCIYSSIDNEWYVI